MNPRHKQIFESLQQAIVSGRYQPGQRLPSEAALVKQFDTSRITVGRAMRDLQQQGLVERRAGSGTFVRTPTEQGLLFGLLIPELGQTEIFEPICQGMAQSPQQRAGRPFALLWGNTAKAPSGGGGESKEEQAWQLCHQYTGRKVDGVFFAPLELTPSKDRMNRQILEAFDRARIPVVLLDRDACSYPERSGHDLVGIGNRRAGYLVTEHLLARHGAKRIAFLSYPNSAPTVQARLAGYREAHFARGAAIDPRLAVQLDPAGVQGVRAMFEELDRPEAFVCANDRTAGQLMRTLLGLGIRVPDEVRIVGIDDVEYARLLPAPLTTVRQPCREVGEVAIAAMLDRVAHPGLPAREILLDCRLVVRQSCGCDGLGV